MVAPARVETEAVDRSIPEIFDGKGGFRGAEAIPFGRDDLERKALSLEGCDDVLVTVSIAEEAALCPHEGLPEQACSQIFGSVEKQPTGKTAVSVAVAQGLHPRAFDAEGR